MTESSIKKNSNCESFSKGFRKKYARLINELGYEEVIHRLNIELKHLSVELQALTAMSTDVDSKRTKLDQVLLKICADWRPRYNGDSIMNSEALRAYNDQIDRLYEWENERADRLAKLSDQIALISIALDTCDKLGRCSKKEHTA